VILEAFSKYLHEADPSLPSTDVLARWLWEKLSMPPVSNVDQVIHCEITICRASAAEKNSQNGCQLLIPKFETDIRCTDERRRARPYRPEENDRDVVYVFRGTSKSGERLLNSLREYCLSYEHQKWARWIHNLKASDFAVKDLRSDDKIE